MKTITIIVSNTFLDSEIARYIMPYNPLKAMFGWYSDFWKSTRLVHRDIEQIDKIFIRSKIIIENKKTDRIKVLLPSGAGLDCPFDLKPIDCDVINLHLKGVKLAKFGY